MPKALTIALSIIIGLPVATVLIGWIGLQFTPQDFPAYPERATTFETVPLPDDLPAPVARFYRAIIGDDIPVLDSAVITASADLRFMGIPFPANVRFTHDAGQGYRHYIESYVFGQPLLRVNERYLDGNGVMELPVGTIEQEPKINSAANLGLWGESIWLPSIWITDPRVRWEAVDDTHARLIVPLVAGDVGEAGEDEFLVTFDAESGLLIEMEAMRWKDADSEEKTRWLLRVEGWIEADGIMVPSPATVTWADEGTPWLVTRITDIAYNADVAEYVRARGL
jgi:hypothetical protein